jgi:hypothetical protein
MSHRHGNDGLYGAYLSIELDCCGLLDVRHAPTTEVIVVKPSSKKVNDNREPREPARQKTLREACND